MTFGGSAYLWKKAKDGWTRMVRVLLLSSLTMDAGIHHSWSHVRMYWLIWRLVVYWLARPIISIWTDRDCRYESMSISLVNVSTKPEWLELVCGDCHACPKLRVGLGTKSSFSWKGDILGSHAATVWGRYLSSYQETSHNIPGTLLQTECILKHILEPLVIDLL